MVSSAMLLRFAGFMCSSVRMLCRRSASLTSSTRMSLEMASSSLRKFSACSAFLVTRSSFLILVRPSTSAPISRAEQRVDLAARGVGVLDGVVQQRGGDGGVVEPHLGEDGGDFERMGEEGSAGGPLLVAMRLHGVDIGAVEQRLVGVGLVAQHPLDQLVLAQSWRAPHDRRVRCDASTFMGVELDQRERGPALEPSEGAWVAILRNSSSSVILSIALSLD